MVVNMIMIATTINIVAINPITCNVTPIKCNISCDGVPLTQTVNARLICILLHPLSVKCGNITYYIDYYYQQSGVNSDECYDCGAIQTY